MIVLDTNVISELFRPMPDERVPLWMNSRPKSSLFTTTITRSEIFYGVEMMPTGKRKTALITAAVNVFESDMHGHVLAFDNDAADHYASIATSRRNAGRPISQFDAMIVAIARSRGAALATRNIKDFIDCGVTVIDPWNT